MNYRHEFMRGVMRKLGYMLAALLVAGLLSMFGSFKANAQSYANCNLMGAAANGSLCPDMPTAYAAAKAAAQNYVQQNSLVQPPLSVAPGSRLHVDTLGRVFVYVDVMRSGEVQSSWYRQAQTNCPNGSPWDTTKNECATPCNQKPPLPSGTWVINAALGGAVNGVCKEGCAYVMPSNSIIPCQTVDGQTYCSVGGATPTNEITCNGINDLFGTPPQDSDHDGTSDANDGAPNNPGSTTGDGNPPSQPQGPEGPKEDGSKACGGTGQPACPPQGEGSGDGKGSGNGNTSGGGGDCGTKPTASGDAILANILFQTWSTRCATEALVKKGSAVQGGGEGEGEGASVQDGGCTPQGSVAGFYCSGDPVGCKTAEKLAIANCRAQATDADGNGQPDWTQGDSPEIPGDGDGDFEEPEFGINVGTGGLDTSDLFGGGSCPSFSFSIFGEAVSTSDIPEWCGMVAIMRAAVLIMGAYLALRILYGGI